MHALRRLYCCNIERVSNVLLINQKNIVPIGGERTTRTRWDFLFSIMSKILHLNLKKKWFDMIASGEKKEEYREIKPHWVCRLCCGFPTAYSPKDFDCIIFKNGYSKNARSMQVECLGIETGKAKPEWSDNWQGDVFIIKLGKVTNLN